jgi:hypothetical protein
MKKVSPRPAMRPLAPDRRAAPTDTPGIPARADRARGTGGLALLCLVIAAATSANPPAGGSDSLTQGTDTADGSSRYAIEGDLRIRGVSDDGRFTLDADARYAPQARSPDQRYTLKSVNAPLGGCAALPDPLFSNGFE